MIFSIAVIISDNRNGSLSKTIDRHHQEILQFIVDTEKSNCCCRNRQENTVYCKCHNTSDGLHDNCRKPHPVNISNISPPEMIVFRWAWMSGFRKRLNNKVAILHHLSDDSCDCCTTDSHCRAAKQTENHNGIKNNIQNSTYDQRNHR